MGHVQLKGVAVLVDVAEDGLSPWATGCPADRESPARGTFLAVAKIVGVLERDVRAAFSSLSPASKEPTRDPAPARSSDDGYHAPVRRVKAAVDIIPGAKLVIRES